VLFNTAKGPDGKLLAELIDSRIHEAADKVKIWPLSDQFVEFSK
jgi:hypothetical protein